MRKTLKVTAALALISVLALAGCTSKPADGPANAATTAAETTTFPDPIPLKGKPIDKSGYEEFMVEKDGVKHFYLWIEEKEWEILKGVSVPVWAFNGTVPGPEIRVTKGDQVAVHLKNTSSQPHSIHFHGQLGLTTEMDGVPATSAAVNPGQEFVYTFPAENAGTLIYHCHVATYYHLDMGLYGAFNVDDPDEEKTWDKEYTFILDDWAVGPNANNPLVSRTRQDYNYFTVNGKAFPESEAIEGNAGEVVKMRFVNVGYRAFSMHTHGYAVKVTHLDGFKLDVPYTRDVITINPGERVDCELTLRPGIFPVHDHQLENVLNNGEYLGGATFLIIGK